MSWCLLIALLLGAPFLSPCGGSLHGFDSGATPTGSAAGATALLGSSDRSVEGGAEALRRFASTRAMKTGTTIAGVVFEVSHVVFLTGMPTTLVAAASCPMWTLFAVLSAPALAVTVACPLDTLRRDLSCWFLGRGSMCYVSAGPNH